MTNLNGMFAEKATEINGAGANARVLAGTAQLTTMSLKLVDGVLEVINKEAEKFSEAVVASMKDHNAMDNLLNQTCAYNQVDTAFLRDLDNNTLENMLKSQQSKRSRTKGKVMTKDNYRTLMSGAVAEHLLRSVMGKDKKLSGRAQSSVSYSAKDLEIFANDQDKLRKVLRNVQSKKSIMKSKEGFSETNERWLELLAVEEQLKSLRQDVIKVDETKDALKALLEEASASGKALEDMNKKELLAIIENAAALCASNEEEPEADEVDDTEDTAEDMREQA